MPCPRRRWPAGASSGIRGHRTVARPRGHDPASPGNGERLLSTGQPTRRSMPPAHRPAGSRISSMFPLAPELFVFPPGQVFDDGTVLRGGWRAVVLLEAIDLFHEHGVSRAVEPEAQRHQEAEE